MHGDISQRIFVFESVQWLGRPLQVVFAFFSDPRNLESITPPWLRFEIKTQGAIEMRPGASIDYQLRLHGIPVSWQTEITIWDPPHRFVDEQARGPYKLWRHEHSFEEKDGKTLVHDRVEYAVPGGRLVQLLVSRDIKRIFQFRRRKLEKIFSAEGQRIEPRP
jgi:ligand-binding SRPBCC domain-containing protein